MKQLNNLSQYSHWFLRIAMASVFVYHGATKFPNLTPMAEMMGLPVIVLLLVAVVEAVGGGLILLGGIAKDWTTRVGALMLIPILFGAIMAHWGQWNFVPSETHPMGGIEFQVTLLLIAGYLFLKGNSVIGKKV